jgi:hypothetical protein
MENCNLYCHEIGFEKILNLVAKAFPSASIDVSTIEENICLTATIKGGFFSKSKSLKINYRQRKNPSYRLDKVECKVTQNLSGMANFVASFPTSNENIKSQLLFKINAVNSEVAYMTEPSIDADFKKLLLILCEEMNAIVFAQPSALFNKSRTTHFTDKNLNVIIDQEGKCEINELNVSINTKYSDPDPQTLDAEQLNRKASSEKLLAENNIKINYNLPCIPNANSTKLRTTSEIVDRIYALMIVSAKGEGLDKPSLDNAINVKGISGFSPYENYLLEKNELVDSEKIQAIWRYESLNALVWAAGIIDELVYPSQICDVADIVGRLMQTDPVSLKRSVQIRSKSEILDELDKTYRMHWACVDARINNLQAGGEIDPSIIMERHYALNWLTSYLDQDWDDVQTNT